MNNTIRNEGQGLLIASDLNGTLTTGSPVLAVYRWLTENQPDSPPPLFQYRLMFSYLQVKAGLKEIDTWGEEAMSQVLSLVQNPDIAILDEIMDFVVIDELWPKRRDIPVSMLREYHDSGADLYIISAAYQPAVEKFARKIAPQRTYGIGTSVEITPQGMRLSGPLNSREKKMANLMAAIGSRELAIALGDTFADIPLLEKASSPIAVHPDRKLRIKAKEQGWRIIE
jgi:phosphoserine phosphatase